MIDTELGGPAVDNTIRLSLNEVQAWVEQVKSRAGYRRVNRRGLRRIDETALTIERLVKETPAEELDFVRCEQCGGPAKVTCAYKRRHPEFVEYKLNSRCLHCDRQCLGALVYDPYWVAKAVL